MDDTTGRMSGPADAADARTDEIREEIAQTRVELSETIEAIQERLTPSHIVAQAGETVRSATTEKVKQMANTPFVETIRANPIPAAMIGVGAAWLIARGRSRDHYSRPDWRYRSAYGPPDDRAVGTTGSGAYGTGSSPYSAEPGYGRSRDYESGESYGQMGALRYAGSERSMSVQRVVRENPLAIAAAAALVGVAIGMTVPATETENKLMGDARDSVVDRAREMASDAAEKVQNAAEQVKDAAGSTARAVAPKGGPNV